LILSIEGWVHFDGRNPRCQEFVPCNWEKTNQTGFIGSEFRVQGFWGSEVQGSEVLDFGWTKLFFAKPRLIGISRFSRK